MKLNFGLSTNQTSEIIYKDVVVVGRLKLRQTLVKFHAIIANFVRKYPIFLSENCCGNFHCEIFN